MRHILLFVFTLLLAFPALAADEVIISERGNQTYKTDGWIQPILGTRITTQVLDTAELSAAFNGATSMIRICNNAGAALWYKIGSGSPSAAANTAGNEYLPAATCVDEPVTAGEKVDTAADS